MTDEAPKTPKLRGLAACTPERRAEISRMGGLAVPAEKRMFAKDPGLAASAGRVGGSKGTGPQKKKEAE